MSAMPSGMKPMPSAVKALRSADLLLIAPLFSTLLFPVYTGVLVWVALYLRSAVVRALVRAGS